MVLTDGLYAYYKLDGDATDALGVNPGADTGVTRPSGVINQCASFSTATIEIPKEAVFNVSEGSLAFWIKTSDTAYQPVMAMNDNVNDNRFIATGRTTSSKIGVYDWISTSVKEGTTSICDGSRHHIVITSDASGIIFYHNGVADGTFAGANMYSGAVDSNVNIGFRAFDPVDYTGDLDEIGMRNRVLSSTEVSQLYNGGDGLPYPLSVGTHRMFLLF